MRRSVALGVGFMLVGCGARPAAVDDAWVRLPAVAGRPAAAYFELRAGAQPLTVLKVTTPAAIRSELHESMKGHGGMMTMAPLDRVAVPAGSTVRFAPGGKHVMLYDVSPALKPGGTTRLSFALVDGKTIEVDAKVVGASDPAPE